MPVEEGGDDVIAPFTKIFGLIGIEPHFNTSDIALILVSVYQLSTLPPP
jgi:hypothetical protein